MAAQKLAWLSFIIMFVIVVQMIGYSPFRKALQWRLSVGLKNKSGSKLEPDLFLT
jgi:hypothetical protein